MANPQLDFKKILYLVRHLLKVTIRGQNAFVVIHKEACPDHHVHNVYVSPVPTTAFVIDVIKLLQKLSNWQDKYDGEDNGRTFIHKMTVDNERTNVYVCFFDVKVAIHFFHRADFLQVPDGTPVYAYMNGLLKPMEVPQPAQFKVLKQVHPSKMCNVDEALKDLEQQLGIDGDPDLSLSADDPVADATEFGDVGSATYMGEAHPEHVSTVLFMLITLLGGTATIRDMEALPNDAKGAAFQYLRTFYRNKFFNGKEKTGKRPSFLQQYLSPKKA